MKDVDESARGLMKKKMKGKQQTTSIDLVDIVKNSGRIQALARGCCGRDELHKVDGNGSQKTTTCKDQKEAFIFGSWKRRHKRRPAATATVRPVSISDENFERNNNNNLRQDDSKRGIPASQRSSTYYPSSYTTTSVTSFGLECRVDGNVPCEEEFWCPRCSQRMQEPRLLPCLHPICTPCVDQLMSQGMSTSGFREGCPICETPLPCFAGLTNALPPPHYPLQHRLVMDAVRRRLAHQVLCCDTCPEEVQASVHCPACLRNFCSDCGTEHQEQEVRAYKVHEVRPLWEARRVRRTALCLAHPTHALRFHCIACQQVTCRECMWRGAHRGHASEGASGAGRRAAALITAALQRARTLLNSLLVEYNSQLFSPTTLDRRHSLYNIESERYSDTLSRIHHSRSRSTLSSHTKEAKARMQEFARLQRARYLLDAIALSEELLADGADVEILSLSGIILKRLKNLGVKPLQPEKSRNDDSNEFCSESQDDNGLRISHPGVYHCCTFCSSGGRKEAVCACRGTMPGGYRGCGHGHVGHPGVSHWSCCGSIHRHGACRSPKKCVYQIIL
ncbi:E3 ubiquitin-protein ligase TRIM45 [Neodiprion pinetum]|uniref:E3 ubiquitin-protein ligase TRIM45 n=1 Tax=Neodiprion pinetum TaxID=441929 RepID=UPI001EDCC190|nr:tripartite motif-containing protein 45 [Neodiprion pinetum]